MRASFSWLTGFFKTWVYQFRLKRRREAEGWSDEVFYRKTFTHRDVPVRSTDKFASTRRFIAGEIGSEDSNTRILDLASGFGFLAKHLYDLGYRRVYAMDLVPYRVAHASRIHFPIGIQFLAGDIRSLCVPAASFDAITISVALHDLATKEIGAVLRECYGAIRPGGRFLIMEPHYDKDIPQRWFR